jgi:subtilase family serine protease
MRKLKTALYGAAMVGCVFATAAFASTPNIGTLSMAGPAQATQVVHFDVFLPLRNKDKLEALLKAQQDPKSAQYHKWLTPAQFGEKFGPDKATLNRVAAFLQSRGFGVKTYTRSVRATGTVDQVNKNFGVHLAVGQSGPGTNHIVTNERFAMPATLASAGAQIFSFAPHAALVNSQLGGKVDAGSRSASGDSTKQLHGYISNKPAPSRDNRYSATGPYWFTDLKQAYKYPSARATVTVNDTTLPLNGSHAVIAAMMSSDVLDSDIAAIFDHEQWTKFSHTPDPTLAARVYIDGGAPFVFGSGASAEASLDVQQELTSAPGAAVVLYDIPSLSDGNVMAGYLDVDEQNGVDVLSSSFGECERFYFPQYNGGQDYTGILRAEHELFQQGNSQGITFLASSGDSAGQQCPSPSYFTGGPAKFIEGIQTPASDPSVTAVGGTNLVTTFVPGTLDSGYVGENAWEDPEKPYDPYGVGVPVSGGVWGAGSGYSRMWTEPNYQQLVDVGTADEVCGRSDSSQTHHCRAVPDIGMTVGGCPFGLAIHRHKCDGGDNPKNGSGNRQRSRAILAWAVGKGGGLFLVIGTSVASPEFAGVVAHIVEQKGRQGNLNPYIYNLAVQQAAGGARVYHTNIPGYNGIENTDLNSEYSLSTGVGTPYVTDFIGQPDVKNARIPQTHSNP